MNQSISEDYLDRFSEVAKGLGLSKNIANKLANFIHYEVLSEKKKALTAERKELREKVKIHQDGVPTGKVCDYENKDLRVYCDGRNDAFDEVLALIKE